MSRRKKGRPTGFIDRFVPFLHAKGNRLDSQRSATVFNWKRTPKRSFPSQDLVVHANVIKSIDIRIYQTHTNSTTHCYTTSIQTCLRPHPKRKELHFLYKRENVFVIHLVSFLLFLPFTVEIEVLIVAIEPSVNRIGFAGRLTLHVSAFSFDDGSVDRLTDEFGRNNDLDSNLSVFYLASCGH